MKFNGLSINLIYIRNPRERSTAVARNVGVEKARGDTFFLDSDMLVFNDFIEKIIINVFKEKSLLRRKLSLSFLTFILMIQP
ncbi:MAG: glycosyltransferase family 2 protein [Candidatus Brockarchaeota archaeon]|nr:glycosyltransferase family 2 protein [Candidatus Brockarchaeota archaeon]